MLVDWPEYFGVVDAQDSVAEAQEAFSRQQISSIMYTKSHNNPLALKISEGTASLSRFFSLQLFKDGCGDMEAKHRISATNPREFEGSFQATR